MDRLLLSSKEIIEKAIADYKPYATVLMLSGGNDSNAALHVARELGVKIDFVMHGVTGTGIQEATDFVRRLSGDLPYKYIEANAGDTYLKYVLRKGFMGIGPGAHEFSYHLLKATPFKAAVSKHIRQKTRKRVVLLINGARRQESENRMKMMINPCRPQSDRPNNIWVNIINEWPNHAPQDYLEDNGFEINPVSQKLCRSGECMCGTQQTMGDGAEAAYFFPEWGKWWTSLRAEVMKKFSWDWGEGMPKGIAMERKGQLNMFQPMCHSCIINHDKANGD